MYGSSVSLPEIHARGSPTRHLEPLAARRRLPRVASYFPTTKPRGRLKKIRPLKVYFNVHDEEEVLATPIKNANVVATQLQTTSMKLPPERRTALRSILVKILACSYQQGTSIKDFLQALDMSDGYKDGKINAKEMKDGFESFGLVMSRKQLNTMLCNLNTDTEGQIDLSDFEELIRTNCIDALYNGNSIYGDAMRDMTHARLHAKRVSQKNQRGRHKQTVFGIRDEEPVMTPAMRAELQSFFSHNHDVSLLEIFKAFDTDGSGIISSKEFADGMQGLQLDIGQQEIENLAAIADSDCNGIIEYKDFIGVFKDFVPDSGTLSHPNSIANKKKSTRRKSVQAYLGQVNTMHNEINKEFEVTLAEKEHNKDLLYANLDSFLKKNQKPPPFSL